MSSPSTTTSGLADRYATALFDLANERDALESVSADLDGVRAMLAESSDLRRMIKSPLLSGDDQKRAMAALADNANLNELTSQFLGLLAVNRRLFALSEMIEAFQQRLARHRGELRCEIVSAVDLTDDQVASLRQGISTYAEKDVRLDLRTDPSILGGLIVRLGSRMFDASLATKLRNLEHSMRGIG
ncbi:MAG: F0F1 ATP synthase subunit delta [Pseudomonadota bacterium]